MNAHRILFILTFILIGANAENVTETEMFSITITPKMFNWTYQEFDKQYSFHASILNKPDLPIWLHYIYSIRHHAGFIYGTPPLNQGDLMIQIIALNKENYETRQITIPLHIVRKNKIAKHQVQIKIDNLNVEDLLDKYRMEQLKDIFRKKLWKESANDLYTTFMVSAIELGARLPLKPNEGEGVVLKLGSFKPHSTELLQLQEEVRPLFKLLWCPRDFKRTTVERLFRDVGFNLDWCTFRLVEATNPSSLPDNKFTFKEYDNLHFNKPVNKTNSNYNLDSSVFLNEQNRWLPPAKHEIPQRSYVNEFTFTIIVPMFVMILLVSILSMILCFHHEGMGDTESEYFFNSIFHICDDYVERRRTARNLMGESKLDISHFQNEGITDTNRNNSATNIQSCLGDNLSNKSALGVSPNNSLSKHPSPRSNPSLIIDYNRPQPPPYLGSNTNTLVLRQRQALEDELIAKRNQARTLEESLQMLNEANIINPGYRLEEAVYAEKVALGEDLFFDDNMDTPNGYDEYVPIKPENGISLRHNAGMLNGSINNGSVTINHHDGF